MKGIFYRLQNDNKVIIITRLGVVRLSSHQTPGALLMECNGLELS